MATKLKNLKISKVDFVDEGANPDADIKMRKRKDGKDQPTKEHGRKETGGVLKKLFGFIGAAAGMEQEEIDSAIQEIQKGGSASFNERLNEAKNRKISDEIWDLCYALQSSLCSILNDEELDSAGALSAMQESVDEFSSVVKESIQQWSEGKAASIIKKSEDITEDDLEIMKSARDRLTDTIEKASSTFEETRNNFEPKGDGDDMGMKIDKSKMTPAERAFYEDIEKRCGVEDGNQETTVGKANTKEVKEEDEEDKEDKEKKEKSGKEEPDVKKSSSAVNNQKEDIYKGLHPAVAAEMEELRKFRQAAEEKELAQVAKKYAVIGKKEEELVPLFKSLRAAGGTAYKDMIAILDQTVETVEKSGAFSEIGKSGHSFGTSGTAEAKIETIAKGYMEKDSSMDYASAVAKAWEDNPELMDEYETEAGF